MADWRAAFGATGNHRSVAGIRPECDQLGRASASRLPLRTPLVRDIRHTHSCAHRGRRRTGEGYGVSSAPPFRVRSRLHLSAGRTLALRVLHVAQPSDGGALVCAAHLVADQIARGWTVGVATQPNLLSRTAEDHGADYFPWSALRQPGFSTPQRNPSTLAHRDRLRARRSSPARGQGRPLRKARGERPPAYALSATWLVLLRRRRPAEAGGTPLGALRDALVGGHRVRKRRRARRRRRSRHPCAVDGDSQRCRHGPLAPAVV